MLKQTGYLPVLAVGLSVAEAVAEAVAWAVTLVVRALFVVPKKEETMVV